MIARALSRYADASLRAELDRTRDARDQARDTARRLFRRLQAARATAATNKALMERWRGIARQAQDQLANERARASAALNVAAAALDHVPAATIAAEETTR